MMKGDTSRWNAKATANLLNQSHVAFHNVNKGYRGAHLGKAYAANSKATANVQNLLARHEFTVKLVVPAPDLKTMTLDIRVPYFGPYLSQFDFIKLKQFSRRHSLGYVGW